ncbi:uncharacterized protein zgc:112496 isoform X1 [Polypterus senegalus]|uniref:uncharacterized protein zgc:112496 isoform X1 n=2 Tax=Polypterus senegalus TaxID=55291 RepID=UPI00196412E6|nr:uncharacterized protein zgc:112496 isoform X1 [Polypterus senegalus]
MVSLVNMASKAGLYTCDDPVVWRTVHEKYWDVVLHLSKTKGKQPGKLLSLDKWYQEELPSAIAERSVKFLCHDELVKLMEWKLTRGKFRPRLQQLVTTNCPELVIQCTTKAFDLLPDVQAAITVLCSLKALGPATASAVLAAGSPDQVAFMADEAMECIPGLTPIQYTGKHYALYLQKVTELTHRLNKADSKKEWTPHMVELCLWAWTVAEKLNLPLLEGFTAGGIDEKCKTQKPKRQKTE